MTKNRNAIVAQQKAQASNIPVYREFLTNVHLKEVDDCSNTRYNS